VRYWSRQVYILLIGERVKAERSSLQGKNVPGHHGDGLSDRTFRLWVKRSFATAMQVAPYFWYQQRRAVTRIVDCLLKVRSARYPRLSIGYVDPGGFFCVSVTRSSDTLNKGDEVVREPFKDYRKGGICVPIMQPILACMDIKAKHHLEDLTSWLLLPWKSESDLCYISNQSARMLAVA